MSSMIEQFLSQCNCTVKKNKPPHKYSEIKHILASHPLHILAIDLYTYKYQIFFTAICLYSKFCWVTKVLNKTATTVLQAYTCIILSNLTHYFVKPMQNLLFFLVTMEESLNISTLPRYLTLLNTHRLMDTNN